MDSYYEEESVGSCSVESQCPSCGERRMDYLTWTEDEVVVCHSCGTTYDPSGKAQS